MGKIALIAVLLLGVAVMASFQSRLDVGGRQRARLSQHESEVVARAVARSGYAEAAHTLVSAPPSPSQPLPSQEGRTGLGTYRTEFERVSTRPQRIRTKTEGFGGSSSRHVVEALFEETYATTGGDTLLSRVPPYLRYALLSRSTLRLAVLPRVFADAPGRNANIHTNGTLDLALSASALLGIRAVEGFGTYSQGLRTLPLVTDPSRAFRPAVNPDHADPLAPSSPVEMDRMDISAMASAAATETQPSVVRLLGRVQLGTRASPKVIHVRGDLVLVDPQFEGYGVFLVEGSVLWESTLSGLFGKLSGRPESRVGVYADGPIVFNGTGDLEGQFVSNESVTFSGAATLYGNVAARGAIHLLAAPSIRFFPPSPALTQMLPGNPQPDRMTLVALREWESVRP